MKMVLVIVTARVVATIEGPLFSDRYAAVWCGSDGGFAFGSMLGSILTVRPSKAEAGWS